MQTFNTAIRRRLGRKHSGDEAFEYLAKLCELDAVIVADLMFGLPNQTDEVWQNDIARAAERCRCPVWIRMRSTFIPCCPSTA